MSNNKLSPFLSVIVPVYNTAAYLPECLDSVLSLPVELEVVIVNDGSTDNSAEIITEYSRRFSCVKVIEQPNRGLSVARNKGLEAARGKFLLFVDSDDIVRTHGIMKMVDMAKTCSPDIVMGKVESFWEEETRIWSAPVLQAADTVVRGDEMLGLMMSDGFVPMVFAYMYRRDFIVNNGFSLKPGIIHEDELWTPMVLSEAESICASGMVHYRYRQRSASIMHTISGESRFLSIATIVHILLDKIFSHQKISDTHSNNTHSFLWWRVSVLMQILAGLDFPSGELLIGQLLGRISNAQSGLLSGPDKMTGRPLYCYLDRIKNRDITPC